MNVVEKPLDERYLTWLYSQVAPVGIGNPVKTHWHLLGLLYRTEFVWWVGNDENRAEEGKALRSEFNEDRQMDIQDQDWMELGCSMLELLIVLSRRLSFEADGESREWFWELIDNLGLKEYTDAVSLPVRHVEDVLHRVNWRTYKHDGHGGLFPLKRATRNQCDVELLDQLSDYILELV